MQVTTREAVAEALRCMEFEIDRACTSDAAYKTARSMILLCEQYGFKQSDYPEIEATMKARQEVRT